MQAFREGNERIAQRQLDGKRKRETEELEKRF